MRLFFTLLLFTVFGTSANAQSIARSYPEKSSSKRAAISANTNLNGQWRGTFLETSSSAASLLGKEETTYVLELKINGNNVSGYSYTYFTNLGPKRYYTICRVTGTVNRQTNTLTVTEVERIRHNTPPTILNCFQVHRLYFEKGTENTDYLKGEWFPAPNQNCGGRGTTILTRQTLTKTPFAVKVPPRRNEVAQNNKPAPQKVTPAKPAPKPAQPEKAAPKEPETKAITSTIPRDKPITLPKTESKKIIAANPPAPVYTGYEKRRNVVVKSIEINNPVFQVEFYDNGEIDGDSISVFFNGKLIVSNKMLTARPLTLTLSFDKNYKNNIITMYAENLGSIPPNTAVMIVRDGKTRHEVRMESDLGKSGSVIFTHNEDAEK